MGVDRQIRVQVVSAYDVIVDEKGQQNCHEKILQRWDLEELSQSDVCSNQQTRNYSQWQLLKWDIWLIIGFLIVISYANLHNLGFWPGRCLQIVERQW